MTKLIAVFLAALAAAGYATAGGDLSFHEQSQDTKIQQLRTVVKRLYISDAYNTYRLDLADCTTRACRDRVTFAYNNSEQWPGWEAAARGYGKES